MNCPIQEECILKTISRWFLDDIDTQRQFYASRDIWGNPKEGSPVYPAETYATYGMASYPDIDDDDNGL